MRRRDAKVGTFQRLLASVAAVALGWLSTAAAQAPAPGAAPAEPSSAEATGAPPSPDGKLSVVPFAVPGYQPCSR
jgi:hypothetical protein